MLTHSTRCGMRSSDAMNAWRRDCSTMPLRASTSTRARSAVDAPGDHVAGVLDVARGVGDDELALRGGEVAVGDVDRDALLALGPQAVGEQRQVRVLVAPVAAGALDRLELVLEDRLRVVEQATDERALAVVDRAGGREPQHLHQTAHEVPLACGLVSKVGPWRARRRSSLKYPSRLRSSMAASDRRSSARVAPRSVMRVAATSTMTSAIVAAVDSTAPVHDASPTVR